MYMFQFQPFNNDVRLVLACVYGTAILNVVVFESCYRIVKKNHTKLKEYLSVGNFLGI